VRIAPTSRFTAVVATALLGGALLAAPAAQASSPAELSRASLTAAGLAATLTSQVATGLEAQLAGTSAGSYQDASGALVVNVTTAEAAKAVTAAGATPRLVTRSMKQLTAATDQLAKNATIPGTAWNVDPVTNQVEVVADATVTGAKMAQLKAEAAKLGSAVRITTIKDKISLRITGGDAIYTSGARCSLGFNVKSGNTFYFLTAGHCGNIGATWTTSNGSVIGNRVGSSFPGNDYALIQYTSSIAHPGHVNMYPGEYDIARPGTAYVGEGVSRSGSTTGVHGGSVNGVNTTVNYPQGSVSGLIRTNVCAEPGDSGGSLFTGNVALGMTSGGSGNCSSGGTTYFQPVTEAVSPHFVIGVRTPRRAPVPAVRSSPRSRPG
jgi:streptogrisin D